MHKLLQDLRSRKLAMINKDGNFFQYNSRDLVYLISPHTSQSQTSSREVTIYKIIGPHNYLLMTLDGIILRG